MKVLVIGATGYIGSHVAATLARAGHDVVALRRPGSAATPYPPVVGDLLDPPSLTAAASTVDRVIHAGPPMGESDEPAIRALISAGAPLLFTTGAAVLGSGPVDEDSVPDPHPVAANRPGLERLVLAADGQVIRPGLVYGHGRGLVQELLAVQAARRGHGVYIGPAGVRWPVVHVDDLAALYRAVIERAPAGTIWHGVGETVRLDAIAATLGGGTAESWPVAEATAALGPLADLSTRDQQVTATKTRQRLGWTPVHTSIVAYLNGSR
jgi:nucleoside-diphosphate-sugar epimerase